MRLIPKNTKITTKVWKTFSFLDVIFAFVLFMIASATFMSNIPAKWWILLGYCTVSVGLFLESDGIRLYADIIQIFKYFVMPHTFTKEHKRNKIDRLMPYTGLSEDGTICYGEYYAKVLSIGSIEFRLLNEWMQNFKISVFASVLNNLSAGQSMQIVKLDRPINFDDMSLKLFDKIKVAQSGTPTDAQKIEILKSRISQIDSINNIEKQYRPYYYIVIYDDSLSGLNNAAASAAGIIESIGLQVETLNISKTALFLKYCNTRSFDERDVDDIKPNYLDFIKPKKIKFKAFDYEIDDVSAFCYTISDYPLEVANAWGANLFNINNTKVVLNIRPIDKEKAIKRVDKVVTEIGSRENVNKASQIVSQSTHLETMAALLSSMQNDNESMFDCAITITAYNNEDCPSQSFRRQVRQAITLGGFRPNRLRCRQIDAFTSSNISRRNALKNFERGINGETLAAVFPFVFTSILEEDGIMLGYHNYPVILDMFKRDDKYVNSNMMIIGKPGGGKSYFTKMLLSNLYSENSSIFVLDPENEYAELSKNVGGAFIDVGNAITGQLNPFHIYDILTDDGKTAPPETTYYSHLRFLESFFQVTLPGIHSDTLELLNNLVVQCYEKKGIKPDTVCSKLPADKFPVYDDLMKIIVDLIKKETNPMQKTNLQHAESYVTKFAAGGRNSNLWNRSATLTAGERFTVFNFQSLLAGKNNVIANGQMLLTMRYLEQQVINIRELNRHNKIKLHPIIAFDEGYTFVDPKHPVMLDFVYYWFKRIRKYEGAMIFITQNVKDLTGNPETLSKTSTIINNSQYHFIFPLAPADVLDLVELYSGAGEINETEQNEISTNGKGKAFVISAPGERT
ncbi:MAG: DUF87 domain-containing protein, partial [Clostridiales bacterium]|nr:DUF87 domain-containing protein [Clostridiales bacterium]